MHLKFLLLTQLVCFPIGQIKKILIKGVNISNIGILQKNYGGFSQMG